MYQSIAPLPEPPNQLAVEELRGLQRVWKERKAALEESGNLDEFLTRLKRDWAVETGVIERLYSWDRGVTEVLIERGISTTLLAHTSGLTQAEANQAKLLIDDQLGVIEGLFEAVKGERPLSEHFIRTLHQGFTLHQDYTEGVPLEGQRVRVPLLKGAYKREPNNPRREDKTVHEYCPPELVPDEMGRLIEWYQEAESKAVAPEVLSAWLHHRFTQIHPFQDGNGRVARALATLVFLRAGVFPLVIRKQDVEYIDLLEEADRGELRPLVRFFAERQKSAILAALAADYEVERGRQIDEIIGAAVGVLQERAKSQELETGQVVEVAEHLRQVAYSELQRISGDIHAAIGRLASASGDWNSGVSTAGPSDKKASWFYRQIVDAARDLGYWANFDRYRSWVCMAIKTDALFELVIALHGYGTKFQGVLVASGFTFKRVEDDEGTNVVVDVLPAQNVFQFNYAEPVEVVERRFRDWLTATIATGLEQWRRSLG